MQISNLGKRFGSRWLFSGIDVQLQQGDRLAIIGSNGSGKSTLIKILAGLMEPTDGTFTLPNFGYAALDQQLYSQLTVTEHLELASKLLNVECDPHLLERVELDYAANYPAKILSTGMRSRLKFALAMLGTPKLLLLDEPGAGLDDAGRHLVKNLFTSPDQTVIFATNDPAERRLANLELQL